MQIENLMLPLQKAQSLISEPDFAAMPAILFGTSLHTLKLPVGNYNYLSVINDEGQCQGVVRVQDVLHWKCAQLEKQVQLFERVNSYQHRCVLTIDRQGQLKYYNEFAAHDFPQQIPHNLNNLPGIIHIWEGLDHGTAAKDLEVTAGTVKYLMDVIPLKDDNNTDQVIVTYCNTSNIKHFVILETIFDHMREGINIVDENGLLSYVNPSSAHYINIENAFEMIGQPIQKYYPLAVLLKVIQNKKSYIEQRTDYPDRVYVTNAIPLFVGGTFIGGISTFRDITEIIDLTKRISTMENIIHSMEFELNISKHSDAFDVFIGNNGSLRPAIEKAQRCIAALGGPRHCVITGETGTGKTALARAMYYFAKRIGVIGPDAPFIEVNCAQFTNPDIAAMEIFGSDKGAFTGAQDKQGLIEQANNGIIFLDEAHALGTHQAMLLKIIEEGMSRRIGGRTEKKINVITFTASTRDLKAALIPELYQRLAQYQISLEPLNKRPRTEKKAMLYAFIKRYEESVKKHYGFGVTLTISDKAEEILLTANYPRNIRQFRDTVNTSIDAALPLVFSVKQNSGPVIGLVDVEHLPLDLMDKSVILQKLPPQAQDSQSLLDKVKILHEQGLGARKIANRLTEAGINLKYYQITYMLQKIRMTSVKNVHHNT